VLPEVLAERRTANRIERDLHVPPDLACWPGHFPDWAVVPGALQVDWAMAGLARLLGADARLERIEGLKFKRPLEPGALCTLCVEREAEGVFSFRIVDAEAVFSLGRLHVESAARGEA
jgi:3-hydroxymyristoyl/3-hydroxydecanoyl-(acyl carrier protein) dehydratase